MKKRFLEKTGVKVALAVTLLAVGITTIVFAILRMIGNTSTSPTIVIRILIGAALIVIGLFCLIFAYATTERKKSIIDAITGALIIGFGVFFCLSVSGAILDIFVGILIPILVACAGGAILIKGIVDVATKSGVKTSIWVIELIIGAVLVIAGTLFTVYHEKLTDVTWILIATSIIIGSIIDLVVIAKANKKEKNVSIDAPVSEHKEEPTSSENNNDSNPNNQ